MTRRAAILACLIALTAKVFGKVKDGTATFLRIEIPEPTHEKCNEELWNPIPCGDYKNYYALSVKYKGEVINITPEELMEALREEK